MIPFLLVIIAVLSYFLGTVNGALLVSRYVFHKDIRKYGSGNAGFTNFVRVFGNRWGAAVIGVDIFKTVIAVLIGGLLMRIPGDGFPVVGRLFAGFCTAMGHMFPVGQQFRGGKGVTCCLTSLWLADWRVGIFASAVFIIALAFSQYVSLSSLCACFAGAIAAWIFVDAADLKGLCGTLVLITAVVIAWRHRGNIARLIEHREPKMRWGRQAESKLRDDRF